LSGRTRKIASTQGGRDGRARVLTGSRRREGEETLRKGGEQYFVRVKKKDKDGLPSDYEEEKFQDVVEVRAL